MKQLLKLIFVALIVTACGTGNNSNHNRNDGDGDNNDKQGSNVPKDETPNNGEQRNNDNGTLALSEVSLEDLKGTWDQPCYGAGLYFSVFGAQHLSGAKRVTRTVAYEKDKFQIEVFGFSSENCVSDSLTVKVSISGQFKLAGANPWYVGGSKIDSTVQKIEVTPFTDAASNGLNQFEWVDSEGNRYRGFCKHESWSKDFALNVTDRDCEYLDKSNYAPYSIVKIEDAKMYFGFLDREHDGSAEEKRPDEWSHYTLSKRD